MTGSFGDESANCLGEALVDSLKSGQLSSITEAASAATTPFEGLFQAGFVGLTPMLLFPLEFSTAPESFKVVVVGGGEGGAAFEEEQSEKGVCSDTD